MIELIYCLPMIILMFYWDYRADKDKEEYFYWDYRADKDKEEYF